MKNLKIAAIIIAILVSHGFAMSGPPAATSISNKNLKVELSSKPFALTITDNSGKILLETSGPVRFAKILKPKSPGSSGIFGSTKVPDSKGAFGTEVPEVVSLQNSPNRIDVDLSKAPNQPGLVRLSVFFLADGSLRVETKVLNQPGANRVALSFKSGPNDHYFGMGERYNTADQAGNLVYNWTQEGCAVNCKNTEVTYFPVPFFLNPAGYGLLLDDTHYSVFDFGHTQSNVMEITNWNDSLNLVFFYGPSPLSVIENYTAFTGRITLPAAWAFGTWVSATANKLQGTKDGSTHVRKVMADCRDNHIPCSALWSEDWAWVGPVRMLYSRNLEWKLNRSRYPDYEQLAKQIHADGFKFLGYFAPDLGVKSQAFKDAEQKGFLAKDGDSKPAEFSWVLTQAGEPDLTNPQAREWWENTFFQKALDYGVDGWMHDFSEYTPADAHFSDGRDGWAVHNDYPRLWGMTAREFFDKARPDGDFAFFMRAGYTGSWKYAPVMWTGDSNMTWDKGDGLPTTIPAATSVGISGFPITSTDIAGYDCITNTATDKELFFRWTELGALLPVMRTHESSGCSYNWLFNSDRETLMNFKKYAVLHTELFPYIYTLARQAADHGWPVVRHLMLQFPDDPGSVAEQYEFMLGDRILVAPVIVNHAREREVYFPPGEWIAWWDNKHFHGPAKIKVPAPLDTIPMFVKAGTIVPVFDSSIDTLVKTSNPALKGWDDANKSIKVLFFGDGEDRFDLWDGTKLSCSSTSQKCDFKNSPLPRQFSYEFKGGARD
jgi:alpha-glucosidase (family GH31 glycosyl hydrolase)